MHIAVTVQLKGKTPRSASESEQDQKMPRATRHRPKRRRVQFDESYSFGPFRIGRLGRLTVLENRSSAIEHEKFVQRSAAHYETVVKEMNQVIGRIRAICATRHPLQLLQAGYYKYSKSFLEKEPSISKAAKVCWHLGS